MDSDIVEKNEAKNERRKTSDTNPEHGRGERRAGSGVCVVWYSVKCPGCNSKNTKITTSRDIPYRYHKCENCGLNFTSYEANYDENAPALTSTIRQSQTKNTENGEKSSPKTGDFWSKRARL